MTLTLVRVQTLFERPGASLSVDGVIIDRLTISKGTITLSRSLPAPIISTIEVSGVHSDGKSIHLTFAASEGGFSPIKGKCRIENIKTGAFEVRTLVSVNEETQETCSPRSERARATSCALLTIRQAELQPGQNPIYLY